MTEEEKNKVFNHFMKKSYFDGSLKIIDVIEKMIKNGTIKNIKGVRECCKTLRIYVNEQKNILDAQNHAAH